MMLFYTMANKYVYQVDDLIQMVHKSVRVSQQSGSDRNSNIWK